VSQRRAVASVASILPGRYRSGQTGQTVNLLAYAFNGSNPFLPTIFRARGCAHLVRNFRARAFPLDTLRGSRFSNERTTTVKTGQYPA
jgi:hypothetical protein